METCSSQSEPHVLRLIPSSFGCSSTLPSSSLSTLKLYIKVPHLWEHRVRSRPEALRTEVHFWGKRTKGMSDEGAENSNVGT